MARDKKGRFKGGALPTRSYVIRGRTAQEANAENFQTYFNLVSRSLTDVFDLIEAGKIRDAKDALDQIGTWTRQLQMALK